MKDDKGFIHFIKKGIWKLIFILIYFERNCNSLCTTVTWIFMIFDTICYLNVEVWNERICRKMYSNYRKLVLSGKFILIWYSFVYHTRIDFYTLHIQVDWRQFWWKHEHREFLIPRWQTEKDQELRSMKVGKGTWVNHTSIWERLSATSLTYRAFQP